MPIKRTELAQVINEEIRKSEFKHALKVKATDFTDLSINSGELIAWAGNNKTGTSKDRFGPFFESLIPDRVSDHGTFYHFLKPQYALSILVNKKLQLTSVHSLKHNDQFEINEFLERGGFENGLSGGSMEKQKKNIFIFCFTKDFRSKEHWDNYGNDGKAVVLGMRFRRFNTAQYWKIHYQFRDVAYDNGYQFEFIKEIQTRVRREFGKELLMGGSFKFSKFYKRGKYFSENEVRLCLDKNLSNIIEYNKYISSKFKPFMRSVYSINKAGNRIYAEIPLNNHLFELEVSEVICGSRVTKKDRTTFSKLCSNVWQYQAI